MKDLHHNGCRFKEGGHTRYPVGARAEVRYTTLR